MDGLLNFYDEPRIARKRVPLYDLPDELTDRFGPVMRKGDMPTTGEKIGRGLMDYGSMPAKAVVEMLKQPVRSQAAIEEAMQEPSVANITNAGVQAASSISPRAILPILAGGYGAAAAQTLGLLPSVSSATAKGEKKAKDAEPQMMAMPGLTAEQNKELGGAKARAKAGEFSSGADRRAIEGTIKRLEDLSADFVKSNNETKVQEDRAKKEAERQEYDRATRRAEDAKAKEMARDWKFDDTPFGKTFNKTGGAAAMIAAGAGGMANRAAHQYLTGGNKMGLMSGLVMPAIEGTGLAFGMNNLPLANDAFLTSPTNPKKDALQAYARELEPGDPRRVRAEKDAAGLPDKNPVREHAGHEFWDQFASRLGTSAVEGIPSALTGNMMIPAVKGVIGMAARAPGRAMENYYGAQTGAQNARAEYLAAKTAAEQANGGLLATKAANSRPPIPLREDQGLLPPPLPRQPIAPPMEQPAISGSVSADAATMKMIEDMRRGGASEAQVEAFIKSISRSGGGILP
jgi:hypothetical protein